MLNNKKKVLIIEDDPIIQQVVSYILEAEGFDVTGIRHRPISEIPEYHADLILIDEWINKREGHMLCKDLKQVETLKKVPVVIFSTATDIAEIVKVCQADGFIAKPFDIDDLIVQIKKYTNSPVALAS